MIEYERRADRIIEVNPLMIPGLVQTRDYARSLMLDAGLPSGRAEAMNADESAAYLRDVVKETRV